MKNRLSKDICMNCKNATIDDMGFHVCSETHMEINLLDIACNNFKRRNDFMKNKLNYKNHRAYTITFNKIFGDREELQAGEFERNLERFNKAYKRECLREKILYWLTLGIIDIENT